MLEMQGSENDELPVREDDSIDNGRDCHGTTSPKQEYPSIASVDKWVARKRINGKSLDNSQPRACEADLVLENMGMILLRCTASFMAVCELGEADGLL